MEIKRIVFFHNRTTLPLYPISRACVQMGFRFAQVPSIEQKEAVKFLEKDDLALVHVESEGDCEGRRFLDSLPDTVAKHAYMPSKEDHSVEGRTAELAPIFGGCQPVPFNI
jgi:hypothetical protein